MNRRYFVLVLGGLPLLAQGQSARAASAEPLVAAPSVCLHDGEATAYCPVCAGWDPDPTISPVQGDVGPATTDALSL